MYCRCFRAHRFRKLVYLNGIFAISIFITLSKKSTIIKPGLLPKNVTPYLPLFENAKYNRDPHWQVYYINDNCVGVVSRNAYLDTRQFDGNNTIRFWMWLKCNVTIEFRCQIWYNNMDKPNVVLVDLLQPPFTDMHIRASKHSEFVNTLKGDEHIFLSNESGNALYKGFLASCALPLLHNIPEYISLVMNPSEQAQTRMKVIIPYQGDPIYEFGHCLEPMIGRPYQENEIERLVEWIELGRMFGIGEFSFYNSSMSYSSSLNKALDYYIKENVIQLRQAPNPIPTLRPDIYGVSTATEIRMTQQLAWFDCLYSNMYRYKYITVFDLDEIIVPHKYNTYSEGIQEINKLQKHVSSYIHQNSFFYGSVFPVDITQPEFLVSMRHRTRAKTNGYNFIVKSITSPKQCLVLFNHYCSSQLTPDFHVPLEFGFNHHYRHDPKQDHTKQFKDWNSTRVADDTMLRFKKELIQRVRPILTELGKWSGNTSTI